MAYTTNRALSKIRQQAADLVRRSWCAIKGVQYKPPSLREIFLEQIIETPAKVSSFEDIFE